MTDELKVRLAKKVMELSEIKKLPPEEALRSTGAFTELVIAYIMRSIKDELHRSAGGTPD